MKRFLKGGEAETYEGVTIEWIRGMSPVMTIYEDGVKREEVALKSYDNLDALHTLMTDKGFHKKANADSAVEAPAEKSFVGQAAVASKVAEGVAKAKEGVERLEAPVDKPDVKVDLGSNGEFVDAKFGQYETLQGFGALAGAAATGMALYYVRRKKNARDTQ